MPGSWQWGGIGNGVRAGNLGQGSGHQGTGMGTGRGGLAKAIETNWQGGLTRDGVEGLKGAGKQVFSNGPLGLAGRRAHYGEDLAHHPQSYKPSLAVHRSMNDPKREALPWRNVYRRAKRRMQSAAFRNAPQNVVRRVCRNATKHSQQAASRRKRRNTQETCGACFKTQPKHLRKRGFRNACFKMEIVSKRKRKPRPKRRPRDEREKCMMRRSRGNDNQPCNGSHGSQGSHSSQGSQMSEAPRDRGRSAEVTELQ